MFDQTPPHSPEAENALLASCMYDPMAIAASLEHVEEASFYSEANRRVFSAMVSLFKTNSAIDATTVITRLKAKKQLDSVGGIDFVAGLINHDGRNPTEYAQIIQEQYLLRKMINVSGESIRDAYAPEGRTSREILDLAESRIMSVSGAETGKTAVWASDGVAAAMDRIDQHRPTAEGITGLRTGFADIDEMTSGFHRGDMIIIAGRPSMGKTSWAMNAAAHAAIRNPTEAVAVFSLEMKREQLLERLIWAEARIPVHKWRKMGSSGLTQEESKRLARAATALQASSIWIDDAPSATSLEIRAKARRIKAERGLQLVVIDYLQLMGGSGSSKNHENRQQEVSEISRSMKALAREVDAPVIAVCQLSRGPEQRTDHRPILSDLRESGSLEQDADVVGMLYRREYYEPENEAFYGGADFIICKQRNGPTGTVPLFFQKEYMRFDTATR